jgi:hypothetical protein
VFCPTTDSEADGLSCRHSREGLADAIRSQYRMRPSYQLLKLWLLDILPLTKDAIHVYIGFLCLLVALAVLRRRLTSYWALVPGLLVSVTMEIIDLRDGYGWAASVKDLINTNLMPFVLVTLARLQTFNF